jgi:hypothetical protein
MAWCQPRTELCDCHLVPGEDAGRSPTAHEANEEVNVKQALGAPNGCDGSLSDHLPILCQNCGYALTLHQPDPELPERLLGSCAECKCWYLTNPRGATLTLISRGTKRLRSC